MANSVKVAPTELDRIREALAVSYSSQSDNQSRQSALNHLDNLKTQPEAPHYGFLIASESSHQAPVRLFGLSLLEHTIRYDWQQRSPAEVQTIKQWITSLAGQMAPSDPAYYRNKLAWLWSQFTKREWAASWLDMDNYLSELWNSQDASKIPMNRQFVLDVLEILSEDICVRDEHIAMLRQEALGQALNEIMIPPVLFADHLDSRGTAHQVRYTREGWLRIIGESLRDILQAPSPVDNKADHIVRMLQALRPTLSWVSLQALVETDCIARIVNIASVADAQVQTAAIECVYDVLCRPYIPHLHDQWHAVVRHLMQRDTLTMLRQAYTSSVTSANDLDDIKYTLVKKVSELLSMLGDALVRSPDLAPSSEALGEFYDLAIIVFKSESLSVSLPVMHTLCKALESKNQRLTSVLDQAVSILLGTCSQRLLRYEYLADDMEPEVILFLREDYETLPEQHAFLGNYRRYCNSVISHISEARPHEALRHILGETLNVLREAAAVNEAHFNKSCIPVLQLEAQVSVVKSALNGFLGWAAKNKRSKRNVESDSADPQLSQTLEAVARDLQQWCHQLIEISTPRPDVARLAIQLLAEVASKIQDVSRDFIQTLFSWVLEIRVDQSRADAYYKEAVKAFKNVYLTELQRLATVYPNFLYVIYDDLERRINTLIEKEHLDVRTQWGLRTILIILCHRSIALEDDVRLRRLHELTRGVSSAWQEAHVVHGVSSNEAFMQLVGLSDLPKYLAEASYDKVQDWPTQQLDDHGRSIVGLSEKCIDALPLRMTTSILSATTDRLLEDSYPHTLAKSMWASLIPQVLPNLIKLLTLATGFSDPENWKGLPPQHQRVVQDMFVDRFWQSGISNESKDDFAARISRSDKTYEGFASTIRGIPRQIRDSCYMIIHRMARFEDTFYGIEELPVPLADAILGKAQCLTVHHLQRTIGLVDRLVYKCPTQHRSRFLPPLLAQTFSKMDQKITDEWARIDAAREGNSPTGGDNLGDEMQAESVVRTTTYAVVNLVSSLVDVSRQLNVSGSTPAGHQPITFRQLVLSNVTILEPLIVLCTHSLRMRDSRCCSTIARLLSSVLPRFVPSAAQPLPDVSEFISTHILRAAISSLNEPYFVDCQRDLAMLITGIISCYAPHSQSPREVLLSLPDMEAARVDGAIARVVQLKTSDRKARAVVLELLESVRGVSIAEAGKIPSSLAARKPAQASQSRSKAWINSDGGQQAHPNGFGMQVEGAEGRARSRDGGSPGYEGLGEMFGASGT